MACFFDTIMMGWIPPEERDHVQSTYSDKFQRVILQRRKEDGEWDKDPTSGEIKKYSYLQNRVTGELYLPDSPQIVAVKCAAIAVGIPFYTTARMVFHLCRIAYLVVKIFYEAILDFIEDWKNTGNGCEAFLQHMVSRLTCRIFNEAFLEQMWEFIKAPYYALGVFIAACEGFIHDPYKAKTEIALIERHWNSGKTRNYDWRVQEKIHNGCCAGIAHAEAVFIAFCMQPVGSEDQIIYSPSNRTQQYKYKILEMQPAIAETECICPPCIPTAYC